ncbi:conserved Plasmodium protein, unknown function [Plasmodium relictum]|uniref:Uncharacterized protein n=1 Tax=Plasmodium relictum TaxID=85471 RepID=A0A1J1H8C8_PLARL|nr:conserved Plasmodium protein, unknown function [Plasmodium relictum]CRH00917.1 conserved Plasmodium protein, unknown function [Plasmodium relictum]
MKGINKIDFKRVKSSYLEKDLKINCENVKASNTKNDNILEIIKNETNINCLDNFESIQNNSNEIEKKLNYIKNSLVSKSDKNIGLGKHDNNEYSNNLGKKDDKENENLLKNEVEGNSKEDIEENEEYHKNVVSNKIENFTEEGLKNKISKFVNKTIDTYNSLKVDKLFLCKNINDLINDKNTDIYVDCSNDIKKKYIYECKNAENVTNNTNKNLSMMKKIEDKIKNNNSTVLKNIYHAFRGTLNDFKYVYLEKGDDSIESLYDKIYDSYNMTYKITRKGISENSELILNNETSKIENKKLISNMSIRTKKNMKNDDSNQKDKQINKAYIYDEKENNKSYNIPNNIKNNFTNEIKISANSDDNNNMNEMNSIYESKAFEVKKHKTNNKLNNCKLINENAINYKKKLSNEINKNMNYDDIYYSDTNKFEYSDIISHYLYNKEDAKNKYATKNKCDNKNEYNIKKKNVTNNIDYAQQKKKSKIIDVQINDKNVFDISPLTQKYKYRSNIILTINKIKNIEKVIEINININDIQLKIPGMRIENIILPYKYSNDLLTIQIKTLNEDGDQIGEIKQERNDKIKKNITKEYDKNTIKYQLKEEISSTIKYYYVFIPLNNITEEIINKQLILITSKYKKIFEKEKLLPDTMYLIQSKNIDSMKEKHLYISIRKCVSGIHFYPRVNENRLNNLNKNNILNTKGSDSTFKPVYVSLYNDEIDREIGNLINENNLINRIKIDKLPEKGYYMINNNYFHFFFNKENVLVCNNNINNKMEKNQSNIENASNLFNLMSNNFIIVKSCIDLFPFYIFPSLEDLDYLDFIEKNEYIKLKFMLHFLAIVENICTNLCSFMNINTKSNSLFHKHIKAVQIDDENNKTNYFTFLYTSYDEKSKATNYSFNYVKPFIFQFQKEYENEKKEEKDNLLDELNENDLFIYEYGRKQSLFLYNIIKNYEDIKNIARCYDEKKHIFYTTDYNKKRFQDYYINILYKYNKLVEEDIYNKENIYNCQDGIREIKIKETERMKNNLRQNIVLEKNNHDKINHNNYMKIPENIYSSDNFPTINNNSIILKEEAKINNTNKENRERPNNLNKKEFNYCNNFVKKYYLNDIEHKSNKTFAEQGKIEEYNNFDLKFKITNNEKNNEIKHRQNINNKTYIGHENNGFFNSKENNNYRLCGDNRTMKEEKNNTLNIDKNNPQNIYLDQFNTSQNEKEDKIKQNHYSNDILDNVYGQKKEQYMYKNDSSYQKFFRQKTSNNFDLSSENLFLKSYDYLNRSDKEYFVNKNKTEEEYESMRSNVINFSENGIILGSFSDEDENNSNDIFTNNIINNKLCIEKSIYHDENSEKIVKILNFENLKIHNENINDATKKCKLVQRNEKNV